jgi:hypothetical protein
MALNWKKFFFSSTGYDLSFQIPFLYLGVGSPTHKSPRSFFWTVDSSRFFSLFHVFIHSCSPSPLPIKFSWMSSVIKRPWHLVLDSVIFLQRVWLSCCLWYVCFVLFPLALLHLSISAFTQQDLVLYLPNWNWLL